MTGISREDERGALASADGYEEEFAADAASLDGAVGDWTGHGPGCGCPACEGMPRDAEYERYAYGDPGIVL